MKKILFMLTVILGVTVTSCTKEETVQPQSKQTTIDFRSEFKKSDWIYVSTEEWKFLDDTKIQAKLNLTTVKTHTYNIINDSFILTTNYFGTVNTVSYPNLVLSNDTVYWKYSNVKNYSVFLIRKK
jgi:hypothetical protein